MGELITKEDVELLDSLKLEHLNAIMQRCSSMKCTECDIREQGRCALGNNLLKFNEEQTCPVPILQAKAEVYGLEVMDENIILARLQENLKNLWEWSDTPRDCKTYHDALIAVKHEFFPTIQKNLNVNVDMDITRKLEAWYEDIQNEHTSTDKSKRSEEQIIDCAGQEPTSSKEQD